VSLAAGQTRTVTVTFPTSRLGVVKGDINANGVPTLEHGKYVFTTGTAGQSVTATRANSINL